MSSRSGQQTGMAGPQNGPPQQRMQNGGQPYGQQYGQPYGQPYGQTQQAPMWSSAAPTQPQFGNMGMQSTQQPMMFQQPANSYNLTYNQPLTQQQPQVSSSMDQSAPKPAMPSPVATQPTNTSSNVTNTVNSIQSQAQNPVAPTQPAYTPPPPAYTPPPASTGSQNYNSPAVNGIVPRPEGTPDYMRDYTAGAGTPSQAAGLLQSLRQEASPTDYNLSPAAPLMNQGQQNLVNMGLNPMIARIYGSRG